MEMTTKSDSVDLFSINKLKGEEYNNWWIVDY